MNANDAEPFTLSKRTPRATQGGNEKTICWGALPLDPDHLNTQPEQLSTYLAPSDPARLMRARAAVEASPGCYGTVSGGGGGGAGSGSSSSLIRTDASLGAEVCLTRC